MSAASGTAAVTGLSEGYTTLRVVATKISVSSQHLPTQLTSLSHHLWEHVGLAQKRHP